MIDKSKVQAPSWLTRGLDAETKKQVEVGYRDAAWLFKKFRAHYQELLEASVKRSEELYTLDEYIYEATYRKALRELMRAFPDNN